MRRGLILTAVLASLTLLAVADTAQAQGRIRARWRDRGNYSPYSEPTYFGATAPSSASTPDARETQSFYSGPDSSANVLRFRVIVPNPKAQLWIDDQPTRQLGIERDFISPPVEPNNNYSYTIRATWMDSGREIKQEKKITIKPGPVSIIRLVEGKEAIPARPRPGTAPNSDSSEEP